MEKQIDPRILRTRKLIMDAFIELSMKKNFKDFTIKDITTVANMLDTLPNALFAGITTFPALLYNPDSKEVEPTPNLGTLEKAAAVLQAAGREDIEINAPGTTSRSQRR